MTTTIRIFGDVQRGLPAADHHVEVFVEQLVHQPPDRSGVVGGIAVDHHIDIGVDIGEHPPDNVPLAAQRDVDHLGAGRTGNICRPVGRSIIKYVNVDLRHRCLEISDDLLDRRSLVEAGNDQRNMLATIGHGVSPDKMGTNTLGICTATGRYCSSGSRDQRIAFRSS